VIVVRPLVRHEFELAGEVLPLHRFVEWRDDSTYLIAWEGSKPVGQAHVAWDETELGVPELQDFFVLPLLRDRGIGTTLVEAAEGLIRAGGHERASLSVSPENAAARRLYERLGYVPAARPPKRVTGTILVRGGTLEVDDTLVYFEKRLVDFPSARSS
jgi:GNAT superfamily N-acetyltransferase